MAINCDDCDQVATVEHHVCWPDKRAAVHLHCAAHHGACMTDLAVPNERGFPRYGREWSHPAPESD